jgi:CRISPR system Cascade subunit CasE
MTIHLLRFDPDLARFAAWCAGENLAPRHNEDDGYAWHALLVATFGKTMAPKPFRVLTRRGRPVQLLAYATADAAALRAHAADFADPKMIEALGLATLASKRMPAFAIGRRLGISARLRPIIRTDRDGDRTKSREIDAYVAAKLKGNTGQPIDRAQVYIDWARARLAAAGVEVESLRLDGSERAGVVRRASPCADGARPLVRISGNAITVVGTIRVLETDLFALAVANGVGRHRAFGYGMLLLSPPEG